MKAIWKDTVIANGREVTRVIAKFDLPEGEVATPGQRYRFVYHCHIMFHGDGGMMGVVEVVK
jgi:FtsP/CotA-like multicopper oxidase with cupredoxin domain